MSEAAQPSRRGLFITGTDTGVGKTFITGALAGVLREDGLDVGVWKPVQSGALPGDAEADSRRLREWSGVADREEEICPFSFRTAVTPELAAHLEARALTFGAVLAGGGPLWARHRALLVEGAGGWYSPLAEGRSVADLALALALPVLIVARAGLGTITHCRLTAEAVRAAGLRPLGFILNGYTGALPPPGLHTVDDVPRTPAFADSALTNPLFITRATGLPILGTVPLLAEATRAAALAAIRAHVDMATLRAALAGA